jgi:isocitrate dehydrogenase kinase/phosphatase
MPSTAGPDPAAVPARRGAVTVKWGFEQYRSRFRRITRRATARFENEDWKGAQQDMTERLALYSQIVQRVVSALAGIFGGTGDEALWTAMKEEYAALMAGHADLELAETFFNSVTRKVFATVGVNAEREFVHFDGDEGAPAGAAPRRTYPGAVPVDEVLRQLLADYAFEVPFADFAGDARRAAREVERALTAAWGTAEFEYLETLDPLFFRNKGAYVVGRIVRGDRRVPFVLALLNQRGRILVDAVLLTEDEVSIVFSYTRSYFRVDVENPAGTIRFLRDLIPLKPLAELYNAIGFDKHGKTVLYRELRRHARGSGERFRTAPGEKGLVMVVFTMPGYDVVLKVIRDRFGPGKTVTAEEVRRSYRFVSEHDRAGRLVDIQEFEHLEFERSRFEPELLDELLREASGSVALDGDRVVLHHLYTERRVTPLNLYLRDAAPAVAEAAVLDFGEALRDLAATDIFPGDLLLKNFGATRHGRVVFYDYDELSTVTRCRFRSLPDDDGHGAEEAPFYAGPRDVFPEEFIRFVGLPGSLRDLFCGVHGELLTAAWWNRMKGRLLAGEIPDVFPYRPSRRLAAGRPSDEPETAAALPRPVH